MRKVRGRRVMLLLASALPLLAKDDIPAVQDIAGTTVVDNEKAVDDDENDVSTLRGVSNLSTPQHERSSLAVRLNDSTLKDWSSFPLDWDADFGTMRHFNASLPLQPPFSDEFYKNLLYRQRKQKRLLEKQGDESLSVGEDNDTATAEEVIENGTVAEGIPSPGGLTEEAATATDDDASVEPEPDDMTAAANASATDEPKPAEDEDEAQKKLMAVDYASKAAGALILEKSSNFEGTSNLLNSDKDRYAIVPCEEEPKFVVVGLSEDILVKQVVLANYERFSSHVKDFTILGSQTVGHWVDLGTYQANPVAGTQTFFLKEPSWARYLKFRFLNHFGEEHYFTLSQLRVHGSTMVQGFHEQWEESEAEEEVEEPLDNAVSTEGAAEASVASEKTREEGVDSAFESSAASEGESAAVSSIDQSSPPIVNCVTTLNAVCLNDWDFEHSMFLFGSSNYSEFEMLNTLSSASICLSSSEPSKSNSSGSLNMLDRSAIAKTPPKSGDATNLVANSSEDATKSEEALTDSPLVNRIHGLIKTTAGLEVNLENKIPKASHAKVGQASGSEGSSKVDSPRVEPKDREAAPVETTPVPPVVSSVAKEPPKAMVAEPAEVKAAPTEKVEEPSHEALQETSLILGNVLERLPSASCLGEMDFAKFKAKILSARAGSSGSGGHAAAGGVVEPIFKKLADEIRTLQTSVSVHDQFAKSSIACYQRVLFDLVIEMEAARIQQDARINKIEVELRERPKWATVLQGVVSSSVTVVSWLVANLTTVVVYVLFHEGNSLVYGVRFVAFVLLALAVYKMRTPAGIRKSKLSAIQIESASRREPSSSQKRDSSEKASGSDQVYAYNGSSTPLIVVEGALSKGDGGSSTPPLVPEETLTSGGEGSSTPPIVSEETLTNRGEGSSTPPIVSEESLTKENSPSKRVLVASKVQPSPEANSVQKNLRYS